MFIEINSADNPKVKLVKKLASRKGRNDEGLFVAEGINLVSEIIQSGIDIEFIMASESFNPERDERSAEISDFMSRSDVRAYKIRKSIFDKLTDAEHGIDLLAVAAVSRPGTDFIESLPEDSCILVCDRVQDPGNIGTMIRTAVAAGYGAVMMMPGTADVYSSKVLRATAGMVFKIPIVYAQNEEELFEISKKTSRRVVVTDPAGGSDYYKENLGEGIALVIGNEGAGISDTILEKADLRVTLPMKGGTESLNAAVAAAILMYEAVRR